MYVAPLVTVMAVGVMAGNSLHTGEPKKDAQLEIIRSTHQTAAAPEASAHCLLKNVQALGGPVADLQPLYGMTRVAVIVRQSVSGGTLAVASLNPSAAGSDLSLATSPYVEDRETFVTALLKGC